MDRYSCEVRTVENGYVVSTNIPGYLETFYPTITDATRAIATLMNSVAPPPNVLGTFTVTKQLKKNEEGT